MAMKRVHGQLGVAMGAAGLVVGLMGGVAASASGPERVRDAGAALSAQDRAQEGAARPGERRRAGREDGPERGERHLDRRLSSDERALLEAVRGYAPPAFPDGIEWHGESASWEDLRGRVVVLQSWTNSNQEGRAALMAAARQVERMESDEVALVLLHTPEGAENVERFLERSSGRMPIGDAFVAVDPVGGYCDELGIYKTPATMVLGRDGTIRHAGVQARRLRPLLERELERSYDPEAEGPEPLPSRDERRGVAASFPEFDDPISNANDLRGKKGPDVEVEEWLTGQPELDGRVVMVEFWATWCPPCRASIPHLNELHEEFGEDAVLIGVSDEEPDTVKGFMEDTEMRFTVAVDQSRRMRAVVENRGIPHAIVMCGDGVVRWQGHPMRLEAEDLRKIIEANSGGAAGPRWVG